MPNGKLKGNAYERKIAKDLSLWWSRGKRDDVFYHTHGSGSIGTIRKPKAKDYYGDIMSVDEAGKPFTDKFSVELKIGYERRRKLKLVADKTTTIVTHYDLLSMLDSNQTQNTIMEFWDQCCTDARASKREPMLIFQRHRRDSIVAFSYDTIRTSQVNSILIPQLKLCRHLIIANMIFVSFNCFYVNVDPQSIQALKTKDH